MSVNLKNYTSETAAHLSMAKIEKLLVEAGATDISKSYENGTCSSIRFRMVIDRMPVFFQLPANIEACYQVLKEEVKRPQPGTFDRIRQQAERTAWKIISDWVEVQLSMIRLNQAKPLQVFLPYVYNQHTNQTLYERMQGDTKLLSW